jgi:hypothetical protein
MCGQGGKRAALSEAVLPVITESIFESGLLQLEAQLSWKPGKVENSNDSFCWKKTLKKR